MRDEEGGPPRDLGTRTKQFALRVIHLFAALPNTTTAQILGKQLLRAGTSVGAHYRESVRARSDAEFVSKLQLGLQELEECHYWMELMDEADIFPADRLTPLMDETRELIAILITCVKNTKSRDR